MSAPTLPELIERIRESGGSLTIELALTEIDRRLTALEERTAPPFSGNEVTANLLRAAEEARAKAAEDGLAMLEKREPGSFGDYPSLQAYLAANKALVGAVDKHITGAESEPVTAGQRAAALVMLGPELRAEARAKLRARVDAAGAEFTAHVASGGRTSLTIGQVFWNKLREGWPEIGSEWEMLSASFQEAIEQAAAVAADWRET